MCITVVLTTFGRSQELLEEAVQGFLLQEYLNKKLLIVNIHPTLVIFEHPDIEIHNIKPFDIYGEQLYYAFLQIDTPLWTVFDDDDIILPWHLKDLYENYQEQRAKHPLRISHKQRWFSTKNQIVRLAGHNWTCCLYDKLSKKQLNIIKCGSKCWDLDSFIFNQQLFEKRVFYKPYLPGVIYRKNVSWSITSNLGLNSTKTCTELVKEMPGYEGVLQPHWRKDYVKEVKDYLRETDYEAV